MQIGISLIFIVVYALQLGFGAGLKGTVPDISDIERLLSDFLYLNSNFMLLISGLLTILTLILVFHARRKSFLAETGFAKVRIASLWPLIPMGLVLNILISSVIGMLPIPKEVLEGYEEASKLVTSGSLPLQILNVAVVTPVVEEIIFRGLIFSRLKKGMPALIAALLSAALFGVLHGQIIWAGYGFVIGLLFIAAFLKYRSLIAPILLHISFNASSFLLQWLSPDESYSMILFILSAALTLALAVYIAFVRTEPLRGEEEGKE
jgi:membrane protease YdiL (CAAX protease family)